MQFVKQKMGLGRIYTTSWPFCLTYLKTILIYKKDKSFVFKKRTQMSDLQAELGAGKNKKAEFEIPLVKVILVFKRGKMVLSKMVK